jgi:predicted nucleotidyltransferase
VEEVSMERMNSAQKTIDEVVRRIVDRFDPHQIIVFGSHSKDEAGPDSDIDLLIIMEIEGSRREKATEIDLSLVGVDMPVDIIVVTPDEVQKYRDRIGTIIYPALHEGKVLYERAA